MPRQKAAVPKVLLKAWIPLELRAKLDLALVSEVEGRVPLGEISEFVIALLRQHFEGESLDLAPFGFQPGFRVYGPKEMVAALRARLTLAQQADHGRLGG